MKASKMLISTLKEAPVEANISSHILLLRAGMIKSLVAGVYNYLPLGLRVLNKIENIIRDEMDKSGALEILASAMQPKELWVESGRWSHYGPELFRFTDRHEREFCLGPTHEEVFTSIIRETVKSQKNLPINIYQIQTKYRDEVRPRFGLMRGREFIMKDAYSFDKDEEGLEVSYKIMYDAYDKIFTRFGLDYKAVLADTGNIGGNGSHQFMALSEIGESSIVYSDCGYAADVEKAAAVAEEATPEKILEIEEVYTPNTKTIDEVSDFLKINPKKIVKTIIYKDLESKKFYAVLVRGDREVNEIKLCNAINTSEAFLTFATAEEIQTLNSVYGYIGPKGLEIPILADMEIQYMFNFVTGANKDGYHLINVNKDDFNAIFIDLRKTVENDLCPDCGKPLKMARGIEVGQIFKLQTKYSEKMNCTYVNEEGKNVPMVMGCYGIGVTRTMASIVEQFHDDYGIKWPLNVAPYHVVVVPISASDPDQMALANDAYEILTKSNIEVILDDRDAKPGFKFKDWDLIGIPYMIICGRKSKEEIVEFKSRKTDEKNEMSLALAIGEVISAVKNI